MKKTTGIVLFAVFCIYLSGSPPSLRTAAESSGYTRLTNYTEMVDYLSVLSKKSRYINMKTIGKSVEGREIYALFFSKERTFAKKRKEKPIVLIFCQQHGNEPSGKEAALIIARLLLKEKREILKNLDLILVPQVNPDGAEKNKRRNAHGMDLNRNHVVLSEPESEALHQLFLDWMPEVTLDVHEYNAITRRWINAGFIKDADEMMGGVTNLCISDEIKKFTREIIIPETGKGIRDAGFRFFRYIVGSPFEGSRIRHSTTAVNDGRQSMGIYNTFSFLIEGKRYANVTNELERRIAGQVAALSSFLETVANHHNEILRIIRKERAKLLDRNNRIKEVFIRQDYFPDKKTPTLRFPVFDLFEWSHTERELPNYEPLVKPVLSVNEPYAYLIPPEESRLIQLLKKHRIQIYQLSQPITLSVETYFIKHVTPGMEEDKLSLRVDMEKTISTREFPGGTLIIKTEQPARLLIPLLLEPQSSWSVASENSGRKYRFKNYLTEGKEYPVIRVMEIPETDLKTYE